jgi:hypothetical protein
VFDGAEPEGVFQWDKHLFDLTRGKPKELIPVCRIYLLEYAGEIACRRITPMSAVAALSSNSFVRHWRMNEAALAAHLRDCSAVAGSVPLYRLFRPRSIAALPDLVRWVELEIAAAKSDKTEKRMAP